MTLNAMIEKLLVIVPCGQKKVWDKDPNAGSIVAKDAYTGPPFVVNKLFAEHFSESWVILSAKHGFIDPDFEIPGPYNVTFKRRSSNPVTNATLSEQVRSLQLDQFSDVVGLGGKEYRSAIKDAFHSTSARLHFPFAGLPIGKAMQAIKKAITEDIPFRTGKTSSMIQTRKSVIRAIEEYERLGRDHFLEHYGFRKAKSYMLIHKGKPYDSKAIVGVAFGYENPGQGPLKSSDFSGGASTVQFWLEQLGFEVRKMDSEMSDKPKKTSPSPAPKSLSEVNNDSGSGICHKLHQLLNDLPVFDFDFSMDEIPKNGIYLLFENGEQAHGTNRIVRIGTHTGDNQLRSRLTQHFLNSNKDRSIFRKNIGRCLLNRDNDPFLEQWELDLTTRAAKDAHVDQIDFDKQKKVEELVTDYMQSNFRFVVFEVPTKEQRLWLEARIISTVSRCEVCPTSSDWLGSHSPKQKIRESGLWQVNELYKTPFTGEEFNEKCVPLFQR
ncbi:DUF6884 domain-containing protein [Gimesia sp.]|uniref:DUF6884 domain-containing protein n=1 Tax=Gimesia sp. TaxID=2024833 RepID=UPI0032ED7870